MEQRRRALSGRSCTTPNPNWNLSRFSHRDVFFVSQYARLNEHSATIPRSKQSTKHLKTCRSHYKVLRKTSHENAHPEDLWPSTFSGRQKCQRALGNRTFQEKRWLKTKPTRWQHFELLSQIKNRGNLWQCADTVSKARLLKTSSREEREKKNKTFADSERPNVLRHNSCFFIIRCLSEWKHQALPCTRPGPNPAAQIYTVKTLPDGFLTQPMSISAS